MYRSLLVLCCTNYADERGFLNRIAAKVFWGYLTTCCADYYLTTIPADTQKHLETLRRNRSRCSAFPAFNLCNTLKPLQSQRFYFDAHKTPTLKAAGSTPGGRTKTRRKLAFSAGFILDMFRNSEADLTTVYR